MCRSQINVNVVEASMMNVLPLYKHKQFMQKYKQSIAVGKARPGHINKHCIDTMELYVLGFCGFLNNSFKYCL